MAEQGASWLPIKGTRRIFCKFAYIATRCTRQMPIGSSVSTVWRQKIGQWPWRFEHYTDHFVSPNLTVTSFMGYSFHVQRFEPNAVDVTTVHSRTIDDEFTNSTAAGAKMMEPIHADGHVFTRRVFDDGAGIFRKVRRGLKMRPV